VNDFAKKLERSSFGTRGARAARSSVGQERAEQVLRRATEIREKNSRRGEGKRG